MQAITKKYWKTELENEKLQIILTKVLEGLKLSCLNDLRVPGF